MSLPTTDAARPTWLHASHASTSWSPEVARAYHIALSHHREVLSSTSRSRGLVNGNGASGAAGGAAGASATGPRNVPLTAVQSEALNVVAAHRHARGDHLPSRGRPSEWARLERALEGFPPVGTAHDADSLSDEEVAHETIRDQVANYGERHIVQLGRAKTRYEEELSADDIASHRPRQGSPGGSMEANGLRDGVQATEGEPSLPGTGMHTGQAAQTAAAAAAVAAPRPSDGTVGSMRGVGGEEEEEEEGERDLDASVDDLDAPREASLR